MDDEIIISQGEFFTIKYKKALKSSSNKTL